MPAAIYDRIVIGAGTTAAVYLSFFPPQPGESVTVIGMQEPWARRGEHRMGQPAHLLMLPRKSDDRPGGFEPHSNQTGVPRRDRAPEEPFLPSNRYAQQIPLHRRAQDTFGGEDEGYRESRFREAFIKSVTWGGDKFKVSYTYVNNGPSKYLYARRVVVATGPGQAQGSSTEFKGDLPPNAYYTGDAFLDESVVCRGSVVAVEGGSATAAWCVEKALRAKKHVVWFTRPSGTETAETRFAAAFPAGDRNTWLLQQANVMRLVGTVKNAQWMDSPSGETLLRMDSPSGEQRLLLGFNTGLEVIVDQYVAALGAMETADFLGDLRNELVPIVDTKRHVHPDGDIILGYQGKAKDVLIVGAGVFKVDAKRPGADPKRYSKGNAYLPTAARPPEGIPTIIASIAALTRYMAGGASRWLDINLANFSDLDAHFSTGVARAFAVLAMSKLGGTYDVEQVTQFITDQVIGTRIMRSSPYGIKTEEIQTLYSTLQELDEANLKFLLQAYLQKPRKKGA